LHKSFLSDLFIDVRREHKMSSLMHIRRKALQRVMGAALLFSVSACAMLVHPFIHDRMTVHAVVKDDMGKPVKDAVVYAMPRERMAATDRKTAIIVENSAFLPFVSPVQVGTIVSFSSRDSIQHHIYSISPAKKLDFPLDKGASSGPIALDTAGIVTLGCAIHDRMVGYLYVMETPYFAKTGEEGTADLIGLPRGTYDVRVWHPWAKSSPEAAAKSITPSSQVSANVDFVVTLQSKANHEPPPPPASPTEHKGG
jgi:plastocyanin